MLCELLITCRLLFQKTDFRKWIIVFLLRWDNVPVLPGIGEEYEDK